MRKNNRRLLLLTLLATFVAAAVGVGCGNATITPFFPCVRGPSTDITFKGGVLPLFSSRACTSSGGCHLGTPSATGQLILAGSTTGNAVLTEDDIYAHLFVTSAYTNNPFVADSHGHPTVGLASNASLILLEPLGQGPIQHPTTIWTGVTDPGYVTIAKWIKSGGANNGPGPTPTCEPNGGATPPP